MPELKKFKKILVANRGEIAIRIFRAAAELGIRTVCVYSKEDKYSLFRSKADESYQLSSHMGPVEAYLDVDEIISIAKAKAIDAIHPGYGFLSENPDFARACAENGIVFIGPDAKSMELMGDKLSSKTAARSIGVPTIPGDGNPVKSCNEALETAQKIGFPIILKASNGGGGRGMRVVHSADTLERDFEEAKSEAKKAFGADRVFIEKYIRNPKHIEVQILGDRYGNMVHLFDRDCSVQRRHQKVVEFAPAFTIPDETRSQIFDYALKLGKTAGYQNAGTLEFLVDEENNPYFIEMNPRIQVEHTVTEMVTGIDIVQTQILIAQGYPLDSPEIGLGSQNDIVSHGFSIQTRITSEDPANNFLPDTGKLTVYRSAAGNGIRLDGGNAFTGAEILPFYDSLLVKIISFDRSFPATIKKAVRALGEMRIRGVKTNIPFLLNVLNHPDFIAGKCSTGFIEQSSELFKLPESLDRASKLIEFIGSKIVNETRGHKPLFADVKPPVYDKAKTLYGAKDEFKRLGAEGFAKKILSDKKLYVTDTTMRDAHQSLFATRMRTKDMLKAASAVNTAFCNAFSVEAWGGATFDTAYRFLKESPWKRLEALAELMPNTMIQMLLRASNAVGYANYPDNVVREFIYASAKSGVDVFRIFDSLNWVENMKLPIEEALKTGKLVEAAVCYTGDISNPNEKKYTVEYYINKALELERFGAHIFAIKDMAGLLRPYAAKTLVTALKRELKIPVHLHTHDTAGNGVPVVLLAAEAGVDIVDLAFESMSTLTSQPSMNAVVAALHNTDRNTGLDIVEIAELSRYFGEVREVYSEFESGMISPNSEIYRYEIPGGQYSNLLAQARELGAEEEFEKIKELYRQANNLLGNIVKVTPSSKMVGDLAIFMQKNGLDENNILEKGKTLSYPDSVVEYFKGMIGQPDGGFPMGLQNIILKGEKQISDRPGSLLASTDLEAIGNHLLTAYNKDTGIKSRLSYALYPKVYEEYCTHNASYADVAALESHVFFHGLRVGEETLITISEGKDVLVRYVGMSEPDATGLRTLSFEVNGSMREVKIPDNSLKEKVNTRKKADKSDPSQIGAPLPGTVIRLYVKEGDMVSINAPIMVIEAMKMETTIVSPIAGVIEKIYAATGERVGQGDLIIKIMPV